MIDTCRNCGSLYDDMGNCEDCESYYNTAGDEEFEPDDDEDEAVTK